MRFEDQVCSVELAKRLKELEVNQASVFYYCSNPKEMDLFHMPKACGHNHWSAFTIAELGEMLPDYLCMGNYHPNLFIAKGTQEKNTWTIGYSTISSSITPFYIEQSEADARAKMLIYLIENGLIKEKE